MEGQELREGKERVWRVLINPLVSQGLERKRSVKVDDHNAFLDRVAARLAYMNEKNLIALCESVERNAVGPDRNKWPSEISIMNWARSFQVPPASQSRLVRTYIQSGAGIAARDCGYIVELYEYLKKNGRPPIGDYTMSEIKDRAEANQRERARIRRANDRGEASPSELNWLSRYMDLRRVCADIIKAKSNAAS